MKHVREMSATSMRSRCTSLNREIHRRFCVSALFQNTFWVTYPAMNDGDCFDKFANCPRDLLHRFCFNRFFVFCCLTRASSAYHSSQSITLQPIIMLHNLLLNNVSLLSLLHFSLLLLSPLQLTAFEPQTLKLASLECLTFEWDHLI